jgi:hypothetical protein
VNLFGCGRAAAGPDSHQAKADFGAPVGLGTRSSRRYRAGVFSWQSTIDRLHGIGPVQGGLGSVRPSTNREVAMRRILFPTLGVVVLVLAYAGQELATGTPSAPRASAQAPLPLREMGDEAKVLKHITVAENTLLHGLARADRRQRPLIRKLERQDAWIEQEADKILADEHKADQMLADEHKAQTAQEPTPEQQQLLATLADLQAQIEALISKGTALTQEESLELQRLTEQYNTTQTMLTNLVAAQQDTLTMMKLL